MMLKEHDGSIEVIDEKACTFCQECTLFCERQLNNEKLIKVDTHHEKFLFELESTGSLKPETIVMHALRVLSDKLLMARNGIMEELDRTKDKDK